MPPLNKFLQDPLVGAFIKPSLFVLDYHLTTLDFFPAKGWKAASVSTPCVQTWISSAKHRWPEAHTRFPAEIPSVPCMLSCLLGILSWHRGSQLLPLQNGHTCGSTPKTPLPLIPQSLLPYVLLCYCSPVKRNKITSQKDSLELEGTPRNSQGGLHLILLRVWDAALIQALIQSEKVLYTASEFPYWLEKSTSQYAAMGKIKRRQLLIPQHPTGQLPPGKDKNNSGFLTKRKKSFIV